MKRNDLLEDIRIHDTYQATEFVTRFGSAGVEARVPLGRSPASPPPVRRQTESGTVSQTIMRDVQTGDDADGAEAATEITHTSRRVDPGVIADKVYRMMLKDLAVERERRR